MQISLQSYRQLLVDYLRPQQTRVLWLAVLLFSNIGLQLVNPLIMRRFLDTALSGVGTTVLLPLAVTFIVIAFVQQVVAVGATYLGENVGWTATNWLRYDLAKHCLGLDMAFHNDHTPGEMIERVDGDINALSNFFARFVLQILGNGMLLFGVLILLFREDIWVGAALTLFVIITLVAINRMRNFAVPQWKLAREASADFFGFLEERLAGTEEIRASGAKPYTLRRFYELMRTFWQTSLKARLMGIVIINTTWILFSIGMSVAFIVSANRYQAGVLTIGTVYLVVHYTGMLTRPIEQISQEIELLQQAGAGVTRIHELLGISPKIVDPAEAAAEPAAGPAVVAFDKVSFAYKTGAADEPSDHVLQDISFRLAPGRVLGLLGRTGSGKTTLTRLLFRLYDPLTGAICLDGEDVRCYPLAALRQRIGMVTQNVQLFNATVRDNLTFFDHSIDNERVLAVIHDLGLSHWFESLEDGLDTMVKAGGGDLSAGEAQLLAMGRIFLKDPGLVILDEASSRLDPATEQLIERAIDRLLENRTAIVIAHRLGTVYRADEIMILADGQIQEHDERTRLIHDPASRFYQLLQTGLEEVLA